MSEPAAGHASAPSESLLRRAQRTGLTSLTVTLPKSWTDAYNIRHGTLLRLQERPEGRLEVAPADRAAREAGPRTLHIDATDAPPLLLARLLVGAYITGQDQIVLTSRREFSVTARQEVERIARRVLGVSLIEDEPTRLEVQVFLDPTKHRLPGLVDRVVRMIRLELDLAGRALATKDAAPLGQVQAVEEEIDRFYLLMARQILLASNDFQIAREIGVPSHHFLFGYRMVAKMLEVTSDLIAAIARELAEDIGLGHSGPSLGPLLGHFDAALVQTMRAFSEVSPCGAHEALAGIERASVDQAALSATLIGRSRNKQAAARQQRVLSSLSTALEMLTIINEITLNRSVEPETMAKTGGRALQLRPMGATHGHLLAA